jgi:ribosomal protein L16
MPPQRPNHKQHKGRAPVPTGGSIRGTTLTHGTWGIRLISPGRRIPSMNFRIAEETIKRRLKGQKYSMYPRIVCNIAVYTSGNDQRMGKGKGSFDYWAARVAHGRVALEISGDVHEHLVKDALRLAGNKLPGK